MTVLAAHVDAPDQRHRLTLLDERRLRCHNCDRTLVLPAPSASSGSTSTSKSSPPRSDERCPLHLGWADACAGCAADAKASDNGLPLDPTPQADVAAAMASIRAVLADVAARRATTPDPSDTDRQEATP